MPSVAYAIDLLHQHIPARYRCYDSERYLSSGLFPDFIEFRNARALKLPSPAVPQGLEYAFLMLKHWLLFRLDQTFERYPDLIAEKDALGLSIANQVHSYLLNEIMSKTILYEFEKLQKAGYLGDADRAGAFQKFAVETVNDHAWQDYYFECYPVLVAKLNMALFQFLEFINEFFGHLMEVRQELMSACGLSRFQIAEITLFKGDNHNNGRHTIQFTLSGGGIFYYKPRSLQAEVWFNQMLAEPGEATRNPVVVTRDNYGIMAHVEQEQLASGRDVSAYYRAFGKLLATAYFFNASDLIDENLIAAKRPIVIDAECAVSPLILGSMDEREQQRAIGMENSYSITKSALVPFMYQESDTFHCPLLKDQITEQPVKQDLRNIIGADLSVERSSRLNTHLPLLGDEVYDFKDYEAALTAGFREFLEKGPGGNISHNMRFRFLNRNTTVYADLLTESNKPYYLEDPARYLALLASVRKDPINEGEFYQLLHGDIPYFHFNSDDPSVLFDASGSRYELPYSPPAKEVTLLKQANLERAFNIRNQVHFLKAGLRFTKSFQEQAGAIPLDASKPCLQGLPACVQAIVSQMAQEGIESEDAFFFATVHYARAGDQHTELTLCNPSIYEGYGGVVLLLRNLYTNGSLDGRGQEILQKLEKSMAEATANALLSDDPVAGFELPAYYLIYAALYSEKDPVSASLQAKVRSWLLEHIGSDPLGDFLIGSSSCINFIVGEQRLPLAFRTQMVRGYLKNITSNAHAYGDGLVYWSFDPEFDGPVGFAHGTAGFLHTFALVAHHFPALAVEFDLHGWMGKCFNTIEALHDPEQNGWYASRKKNELVNCNFNHGAPGIALALMAYYNVHERDDVLALIGVCNDYINQCGTDILFTISNGWLGNYLVQKRIQAFLSAKRPHIQASYLLLSAARKETMARMMAYTFVSNASVNYSLFTGLFGFVYLHLIEQDQADIDFLTFQPLS